MELLWEKLEFGNMRQTLIIRRLDDDCHKFSNIWYLEKSSTHPQLWQMLADYKKLKEEKDRMSDKYLASLIQIKMQYIIDELVAPLIERQKEYYEKNYNTVLSYKRDLRRQELYKLAQKLWVKKELHEIVLDF